MIKAEMFKPSSPPAEAALSSERGAGSVKIDETPAKT